MRLILHIGFHKTGTSAIQTFCGQNRVKLAQRGVLYPETGATRPQLPSTPTSASGHRVLSDMLVTPTNLKSEARLEAIIEETGSYGNINTVILSSETFSAPTMKISPAAAGVLGIKFSEISVLAYLRRQDYWAETFYKEVLCWNGRKEKRNFSAFNRKFLADWLDYQDRLEMWEQVFGRENIIIRSYDDRRDKNIIVDFFRTAGFPWIEDFTFPEEINPSLPNDLVPLLVQANKLHIDREQKAFITNLVFEELARSDFRVRKQALVPAALVRQYREEYSAKNIRLCDRYRVSRCEILSFRKDSQVVGQEVLETSLAEDVKASIKGRIKQFNAETLAASRVNRNRPDQGRVGISCLLKESRRQTEIFVKYHLELGVARIRLYMDDPDDPMADFDFGTERVETIKCTAEFWQEKIGREPDNNGDKLSVCHCDGLNYLNRLDDIDWVINLDADELLYVAPGTTLCDYLQRLPKSTDQLAVLPLEAVFVSAEDAELFAARYFKVPRLDLQNELPAGQRLLDKIRRRLILRLEKSGRSPLALRLLQIVANNVCVLVPWAKADEALYKKYMPVLSRVMREGFLAHREGRTLTRHGIKLDHVTSHRPRSSGNALGLRRRNSTIFVLHYDAVDYSGWYLKWHRRVYGTTTASAIQEKRKQQQEMFRQACDQGEDQLKVLFRDLYMLPEAAVPAFLKSGLIARLEQPQLESVRKSTLTVNGDQGNRVLHFLHISKTGGTAVKYAIRQYPVNSPYTIYLHRHRFFMEDVPVGEKVVFFLRDPVSRFVSGFYSRQRRGMPRYASSWSRKEEQAFSRFSTPNQLALALSSTDNRLRKQATAAMKSIRHVRDSCWRWFGNEEYFLSRLPDILFIGFQEHLPEDFEHLKSIIGLSANAGLPDHDLLAHRNPGRTNGNLEDEAIVNLQHWYRDDYRFVALCRQFMEHRCDDVSSSEVCCDART